MTTHAHERIPQWTLGDRLRKARSLTGLNTRDFAEVIGASQPTVTAAENDRSKVRTITLNAWALATGVDRRWLETGKTPTRPGPDGGLDAERARRYSKPQPSDPKVLPLRRVA